MNDRLELRALGRSKQYELFGDTPPQSGHAAFDQFEQEFVFGRVWARPGLDLASRMIATLSALCVGRRLSSLEHYIDAALDAGLSAQTINEIFMQCGIYAGFSATTKECLTLAQRVFDARGVSLPVAASRDDSLALVAERGQEVMTTLHAERRHAGYANPENTIASTFYPDVVQFCYGELWKRPGMEMRERSICAIASFTALTFSGLVTKFSKAGLNCGLTQIEVVEVVIQTGPYTGLAPVLMGLAALSA